MGFDQEGPGATDLTAITVANRDDLSAAVETVQELSVSLFECIPDILVLGFDEGHVTELT